MHFIRHRLLAPLALAFAAATSFAASAAEPLLLVTAPAALQTAERSGAGFARWFDTAAPAANGGIAANEALARSPAWRAISGPLGDSLAGIQRRDRQAGVGIARYPHRLFDVRWLASADAFFELVGVANRMDRRPFQDGACGETRLVYRLAYRSAAMQSRLPMTVNVELRGDAPDADGGCAATARLWQPPQSATKDEALGRWLVSADGPLAPKRLAHARISQVTTNLQSVRWPSAVRPDLGGHAEYMLRAFSWNAGTKRYDVRPLENTPDVAKLKASAPLRKELLQWLRQPDNLRALDEATLRIPDRFLATEAVSVAPRGLERLANRPFEQVFQPGEWQAVPGSRTLRSPQALLRRLDDLSCMGCHQSRAVAGFHLLGVDRRRTRPTCRTTWRGAAPTWRPRCRRPGPIRSGRSPSRWKQAPPPSPRRSARVASPRASRHRPTHGSTARRSCRAFPAKALPPCARRLRSASPAACARGPAIRKMRTAPAAASPS